IWQKAEKDSYERIDVRKFPSIYDKYSQDPRFIKDFENYTPQEMQEYEDKLREILGPVMFDIEKQKAEELVEDFVHGYETGILTPLQKVTKNPFSALRHFNSDNYYDKDVQTGEFLEPTYTRFIPKDNTEYINPQFSDIEGDADLSSYYTGVYDLVTN